jgi:hypothetical protein
MRTFETEVSAHEVVFDPADRTTHTARAVLAREQAAWKTRIEALHTAADVAEIPTAEIFAYGVENPLWAAMVARIVAGVRPPPVTALALGAVTDNSVTLNWNYATINETGFQVQRRAGRGAFAPVSAVPVGTTTFTDAGLTPGTRYTYRVVATGTAGNSSHQQVQATTNPSPAGP